MEKVTTVEEAIGVLIQAASIGQAGGALNLREAHLATEAIDLLRPNEAKKQVSTPQEAIYVLAQVAELAQKKGLLSIQDAGLVHQAMGTLAQKEEPAGVEEQQ